VTIWICIGCGRALEVEADREVRELDPLEIDPDATVDGFTCSRCLPPETPEAA